MGWPYAPATGSAPMATDSNQLTRLPIPFPLAVTDLRCLPLTAGHRLLVERINDTRTAAADLVVKLQRGDIRCLYRTSTTDWKVVPASAWGTIYQLYWHREEGVRVYDLRQSTMQHSTIGNKTRTVVSRASGLFAFWQPDFEAWLNPSLTQEEIEPATVTLTSETLEKTAPSKRCRKPGVDRAMPVLRRVHRRSSIKGLGVSDVCRKLNDDPTFKKQKAKHKLPAISWDVTKAAMAELEEELAAARKQ
jgi:hypothetical protein